MSVGDAVVYRGNERRGTLYESNDECIYRYFEKSHPKGRVMYYTVFRPVLKLISEQVYEPRRSTVIILNKLVLGEKPAVSLIECLREVKGLPQNEVYELIKRFAGDVVFDVLESEEYREHLTSLAALLLWISRTYGSKYGEPTLGYVRDPESGEVLFLVIVLPDCSDEEWDDVVNEIKDEMEDAGLADLTGKVAIVCQRGLIEES